MNKAWLIYSVIYIYTTHNQFKNTAPPPPIKNKQKTRHTHTSKSCLITRTFGIHLKLKGKIMQ